MPAALPRLASLDNLPPGAARPVYVPARHGTGHVHIGPGGFHRAHQAVYADDALAASGGDWRILGISLRGREAAASLNPQNGLYTLLVQGPEGTRARVIGAIAGVVAAVDDPAGALAALAGPATRVVTLTVTEKAYGLNRAGGGVDPAHPDIAADLARPHAPRSPVGFIAAALAVRRARGLAPFTVLCCDNLPENGTLLRGAVVDFARRRDPALADWIAAAVAFPASMVDRITPAPTAATRDLAARLTGHDDHAAIATEPFCQWVIEDRFPQGRPAWEAGGAVFTANVAPWEQAKLRMLNGTHSMLAYAGYLAGYSHVRDAMADPVLAALARRHLAAAAASMPPVPGPDRAGYAAALAARFANPALAHETFQIAMDGTEKLPQRLVAPALDARAAGQDIAPFAFAIAAWMRHCLGRQEDGSRYPLRDPRAGAIAARLAGVGDDPGAIAAALLGLPDVFPDAFAADQAIRDAVTAALGRILGRGIAAAMRAELAAAD